MAVGTPKRSEKKHHTSVEDFIPYACHFDDETVITKNGELLQVIKITGFHFETIREGQEAVSSLRKVIRDSIRKNIETNDFAIWITTLRRKTNFSDGEKYQNEFCQQLSDRWQESNKWNEQFYNELYVSILIEGEDFPIKNPKFFFSSLVINDELERRKKALYAKAKKINEATNKILHDLEEFGAYKLSIYQEEGIYYSEIVSFTSKIMNLRDEKIPLLPVDLSKLMPTNTVYFQYNAVQVEGEGGTNYGAVLSVKEYHEVTTSEVDKFLQLPIQFIVTEAFDFINNTKAIAAFDAQKKIYDISGSTKMAKISGIKEILEADSGRDVDFGEHQIVITILEDTVRGLYKSLDVAVATLRDLGVVFIREDLFMEYCYWSQLPGNFDFIKRHNYIPTTRVGGYASLYNFPAGKKDGNHWGKAVTAFHTAAGTPYFFNFHYDECGHTLIIGPYGTGKTVLQNFLVAHAQKYKARTFYFECERGSKVFVNAAGGKYFEVQKEVLNGSLKMNPLLLGDSFKNREFLLSWFEYLIEFSDENGNDYKEYIPVSEVDKERIKYAVEINFQMPKDQRNLKNILPKVWMDENDSTYKKLQHWIHNPDMQGYFSSEIDNLEIDDADFIGFDLSGIVTRHAILIPLISYLLHRAEETSDDEENNPEIIVLDEAWKLIDNPAFVPSLEGWLERLIKSNSMVIFASESPEEASNSAVTQKLTKFLKTQIFLPNNKADKNYKDVFGLNDTEYSAIKTLQTSSRQFLLRHEGDSVICKLNLSDFKRELTVLSADDNKISKMEAAIEQTSSDPKEWLPLYYEKLGV